MKKVLFSLVLLLSNALFAQSLTDAERLAQLYSKDAEPMLSALLVNKFGIRDPEVTKIYTEELVGAIGSFFASEYEKRIDAADLKKLNQILNSDAGKALFKANKEMGVKIFQDPESLRSLFLAACVRSKKRLNSEQVAVVAPLCK